jgi:flagellar export protein FliJ
MMLGTTRQEPRSSCRRRPIRGPRRAQARGPRAESTSMAVLDTLRRLRVYQRQQSSLQLKQAEVERERQAERVQSLEQALVEGHAATSPTDAAALAEYHSWRLRQELNLRRENARLAQRARDVEIQQDRHIKNVREELTLDTVIQARDQQELEEANRAEARWMDEIAARRPH